jgi:ABC-type transporter Mla subunit MlaD
MLLERNQALIGFIAVAVIAAGTIFALAMTRGMFDRGHEVTAVFSDAAGLTVDDNVLAAGIRVGRVTSVEIVKLSPSWMGRMAQRTIWEKNLS